MSENNNNDVSQDAPTMLVQAPPPAGTNIPPQAPSPPAPPPAPSGSGNSQPGASGRAIASLVLAILSFICCGFFTGIPAIILGKMEENAINRGEAPEAGRTLAKIGWILGLVATILNCLFMGVYVLILGGTLGTGLMDIFNQAQQNPTFTP